VFASPELRTARLLLKPYVPADEDGFVELFSDDSVTRWMGMPSVDVRTMFRRGFAEPERITWEIWAVWEDGDYVGHAEIKPSPNEHVDGHEIVYALLPKAWGRGLGREVAEAVTAYGFGPLGLEHVYATVDPENAKSLSLLRKLGYADVDSSDRSSIVLLARRPNRS
jgi:RimJ/RimL family protein N-acetyltransferase